MARYTNSVCKKCRRYSAKLFLKGDKCLSDKCTFQKRSTIPGQHGVTTRRPKMTDYGAHLVEKQKAKFYYGIMETQFRKYYIAASKQRKIPTGERLIQLLELRLDNVIYRLGLTASRNMARQFVLHRKVYVNQHYVNIPSFRVKPGDQITFTNDFFSNVHVKAALERDNPAPSWIKLDKAERKAEIINLPSKEDTNAPFNEQFIVEFYSK